MYYLVPLFGHADQLYSKYTNPLNSKWQNLNKHLTNLKKKKNA